MGPLIVVSPPLEAERKRTERDLAELAELTKSNAFFKDMDERMHQERGCEYIRIFNFRIWRKYGANRSVLPSPPLQEICRVTKCARLGEDELVVQQGAAGDAFYILLQGSVSIHVIDPATLHKNETASEQARRWILRPYLVYIRDPQI